MADRPDESPGVAAARHAFFVLGSIGLVVAALYWGQRVFVPLALAVLLTLLLSPVVSRLERRGLSRLMAAPRYDGSIPSHFSEIQQLRQHNIQF